jgi:outer membrane lipoprotein SlyB
MTGAALGIVAFLLVAGAMGVWVQRIRRVEIPADRRGFVACWAGGAVLGLVALTQGPGWVGGIPAGIAAVAGAFFSALVYISPQKAAEDAIQVGESLRPFSATDEDGDDFSISSFAGKPVLLKFFRGHW